MCTVRRWQTCNVGSSCCAAPAFRDSADAAEQRQQPLHIGSSFSRLLAGGFPLPLAAAAGGRLCCRCW